MPTRVSMVFFRVGIEGREMGSLKFCSSIKLNDQNNNLFKIDNLPFKCNENGTAKPDRLTQYSMDYLPGDYYQVNYYTVPRYVHKVSFFMTKIIREFIYFASTLLIFVNRLNRIKREHCIYYIFSIPTIFLRTLK